MPEPDVVRDEPPAAKSTTGKERPVATEPDTPAPEAALPGGRDRAVIVSLAPEVAGGRYPAKCAQGGRVEVMAGVIVDGHEMLAVELRWRHESESEERVRSMPLRYNDEYVASFSAQKLGHYIFRVRAWIDRFGTWQDQFRRRVEGGVPDKEIQSELTEGIALVRRAARAADGKAKATLEGYVEKLEGGNTKAALDEELDRLARQHLPADSTAVSDPREVRVDPPVAGFGAWYEFFPRSAGDEPGKHATLDDAARRLARIKEMGFDVVYLPPVHPIGTTHRKGKDNAPTAETNDPGSPWAIGGPLADGTAGGHKSVHPALGGLEAFDRFVEEADRLDLKVAIDIAFQTSPDHPYVEAHPEWYYKRPDGSIRYAENPPKKYQDVYPLKFEGLRAGGLWKELKSVFAFWIDRGVTTFRVDNPHTKPLAFWEWCLRELREECPELIVLSEAFTRPKVMYHLAHVGFNNSYTYFTWRNAKEELQAYGRELFQTGVADFFRPSFWPNTPDILHDELVEGGRPAHVGRFVLAATMSPVYGVYGPPFEHVYNQQHHRREEYAGNEKYEIRAWNWNDPDSLQPLFKRVNRIRKEHPALQQMRGLRFHETRNPKLIAYTRQARGRGGEEGDDEVGSLILVVVNLDWHHVQEGGVELPLGELGLPDDQPFEAHDLLGGERYRWEGHWNYVRLDPGRIPAHIFRLKG